MPPARPADETSADSQVPVLGYRLLRAFGSRTPQLLDLSDQGDFWYPGWNQSTLTESFCGYQAWASPALARQAEGAVPTQGYPPVLVVLAGSGPITVRPGFFWKARFARIAALCTDDITAHTLQLAAFYKVPILALGASDPIPSAIIGRRLPASSPLDYKQNEDNIPVFTLLLGGLGAVLFALGFTGLKLGGFQPSAPIFLAGALFLLLSFLHLTWQEHHPRGQLKLLLPEPPFVLHPSPFGKAILGGPRSTP